MPKFPNISVISSDDPQLKKEAVEERLAYGRQILPNAEFLLLTTTDFKSTGAEANVKLLESEMSDPGLFGGDRIIKINLSSMDNTAVQVFTTIAANFREGLFIVIELPMLKSAYFKNTKAVDPTPLRRCLDFTQSMDGSVGTGKTNEKKSKSKGRARSLDSKINEVFGYFKWLNADLVQIYPPDGQNLKNWISQRAKKYGMRMDPAAVDLVANCADNNLLMIDQSLLVMGLTYPNCTLTQDIVDTYFTQDARYNGYELPLALFNKDAVKALNILNSFYTGNTSELQEGLIRLIRTSDDAIKNLYDAQKVRLHGMKSSNDKKAFYLSHNIRLFNIQNAYERASREWTPEMLRQASLCLSEASQAMSYFDSEKAYRALQRLAMVPIMGGNRKLQYLSTEPKAF